MLPLIGKPYLFGTKQSTDVAVITLVWTMENSWHNRLKRQDLLLIGNDTGFVPVSDAAAVILRVGIGSNLCRSKTARLKRGGDSDCTINHNEEAK